MNHGNHRRKFTEVSCSLLIRVPTSFQGRKTTFLTNGARRTGYSHVREDH